MTQGRIGVMRLGLVLCHGFRNTDGCHAVRVCLSVSLHERTRPLDARDAGGVVDHAVSVMSAQAGWVSCGCGFNVLLS